MVNERQFFCHFSSTIFDGNLESRLLIDGRFGARTEDGADMIRGRGATGEHATPEEFEDEDENDSPWPISWARTTTRTITIPCGPFEDDDENPPSSDYGAASENDSLLRRRFLSFLNPN